MTKKEQTPYERALARATQDGVQVVEDSGDHWQVRSSDGVTRYTVQTTNDGLCCTCPSRHYCKHWAVCQQHLNEQQAEQEQTLIEARAALTLTERSERALAGQTCSQEERLKALVFLPVAIAAYAVILGQAHAWQWHQAKEEQWDRYQAARLSNSLCG
jgi:hypothetical protein